MIMVETRKPQGADKRARLVDGARRLIYRQGVERTTLADIAAETNVPIGNIYYYFKTKEELVDAIVAAHCEDRDALLAGLERRRTSRARLKALIEVLNGTRDAVSQYGCPIGTLSAELDKRCGTEASAGSQNMLGSMVDWAERQFREMGQPDPRDLAVTLIATYEGTAMLTHSLRDPNLMHRQSQRLLRWIEALPDAATDSATN
jgi:TetR/AcrR family transcriptional regulator, transcriptional repressor for nem operon